jgi:localization factor PodJL
MERALYWYREAAKEGHPEAQYNLGIAHIEGIGTEYNAPLAAAFFESAANAGIVEAAYNLGLIYENGLTGAADKTENALLWYKIAADGGSNDAKAALQQLSSSMQIGMEDVDKMVERMQSIYTSAHGRKAGPEGKKAAAAPARTSAVTQSDRATIAQVQESLRQLGYFNGVADGMSGPQTASAIKTYQTANGLPATGAASRDLLAHLLSRQN